MGMDPDAIETEVRGKSGSLSPAARGLVTGLILSLFGAFAVLAANRSWLLPAVHPEGARLMAAAESMAAGTPATAPISDWSHSDAWVSTDGRPILPAFMATLIRSGARSYVAGLWVLAAAAAAAILAVSWAVGGAATSVGAVVAVGSVAVLPASMTMATTLSADLPLLALAAWLLGTMTYAPRWSPLHGALAGLAWALHPAGIGLVAATLLLPWLPPGRGWRRAALAWAGALVPALLFVPLGAGFRDTFGRPALPSAFAGPGEGVAELGRALTSGLSPFLGGPGGVLVSLAVAAGVLWALTAPVGDPEPLHVSAGEKTLILVPPAGALLRAAQALALGATVGGVWAVATRAPELPGELPWFGPLFLALAAAVGMRVGLAVDRHAAPAGGSRRLVAMTAVWLLATGIVGARALSSLRTNGHYLTTARWVDAEVVRWVDNQSKAYSFLYTNDPDLVALVSGRSAIRLPRRGKDLPAFAETFRARPGAVVLFRSGEGVGPVDADTLRRLLALGVAHSGPSGTVLVPR